MKKINESFECVGCGKQIPLANKTCRNHCPYCFSSLHLDGDIPGDRSSECKGIMFPIEYEQKNGTIKIHFKCTKCGKSHWNKISDDDELGKLDEFINIYKSRFEYF